MAENDTGISFRGSVSVALRIHSYYIKGTLRGEMIVRKDGLNFHGVGLRRFELPDFSISRQRVQLVYPISR